MTEALLELAQAAGIAPRWRDAFGAWQTVSDDTLRHVLAALDLPATTDLAAAESLRRLRGQATVAARELLTADLGAPVMAHAGSGAWRITLEDGTYLEGRAESVDGIVLLPAIDRPGYHLLDFGASPTVLAVAPPRCQGVRDLAPSGRLWGLAVQLYALRRAGDGGIGDFAALRDFVTHAAAAGADAVAISPVHAQFSADLDRFSPYSPSSRVQINVLHADADALLPPDDSPDMARLEEAPLVDWPAAGRARLGRFRAAFRVLRDQPDHPLACEFQAFRAQRGEPLELHARFEALHSHFFGGDNGQWNWHDWPAPFRDPRGAAVAQFARDHAETVAFHAFLQFLADRGLKAAQAAAREGGMAIGLISDLAVGTDPGGSHAWSRQGETLIGLSVGAPPDLLNTQGQDWGLAAFSPTGLVRHGFSAFLEMLRGALRHAGGVRIDHAMGLARLWVLPQGASARQGAYLHYPLRDLMRLVALESHRHRAVVLGEDLGTLPDGFQQELDARCLMGLRVLWFEKDNDAFRQPAQWTRDAVAMTSTHDLATVRGWWNGHDLDVRRGLGLVGDDTATWFAYENRARERTELWAAMRRTGAAAPVAEPAMSDHTPVVEAAMRHVGGAQCDLALVPIEDVLGLADQPNLPGTTDQHPNWRRRLAFDARSLFADPAVAARLRDLNGAREAEVQDEID
jgi:4-alpha-glucanotransferase